MDIGKEYILRVEFDLAYKDDFYIRIIDEVLYIVYKEYFYIVSLLFVTLWNFYKYRKWYKK